MTEKIVDFSLSYLPIPGDGVLRSKFNFFSQYSINTTQHHQVFVQGHHAQIQEFFVEGGGVCGGSRLLNLFYCLKRGSNGFITQFPGGGGGPTFSRGGGPIETHITITCDFSRGSGPLSPLRIRTWTLWHFGTNRLRRACAASF